MYNLNTGRSQAGRTTLARLTALTDVDQRNHLDLYQIRLMQRKAISRYASLLEYFYRLGATLITPPPRMSRVMGHVQQLKQWISGRDSVNVFTDGSTWKGKSYSGVGIYATQNNEPIYQGGFSIQSNGDNFHAEVVGVTVAAMAAVETISCIIYTDSLATINAVKGQRTDRAWVRTPSRGWLRQLQDILVKNPHVTLEFTKGHTGKEDWQSKGNEMADILAKKYNLCSTELMTLDAGGVYLTLGGVALLWCQRGNSGSNASQKASGHQQAAPAKYDVAGVQETLQEGGCGCQCGVCNEG